MYLLLCYNSQGNSLYVTLVTIDKLVETYDSHTRDWDTTPALDSLQEIRASKNSAVDDVVDSDDTEDTDIHNTSTEIQECIVFYRF